ncbi:hypothetical protein [uncultured Corynebacterium sp.]|uniref:hypothetical protein n=1 Tax=uncultured Corynebacterium sp. TaxID=159447 RepID=UPI0025DF6E8C|nr:hypothetical protein [uncultured Corynebacterium sp.]
MKPSFSKITDSRWLPHITGILVGIAFALFLWALLRTSNLSEMPDWPYYLACGAGLVFMAAGIKVRSRSLFHGGLGILLTPFVASFVMVMLGLV